MRSISWHIPEEFRTRAGLWRIELRRVILLVLIVSWAGETTIVRFAYGQNEELGAFDLRRFGPDDYNGHLQNWAIAQDSRGIVYAANSWGILEYDGSEWRLLEPGVPGFFMSMAFRRNRIYLGGDDQFGMMTPDSVGAWVYRSLGEVLPETEREIGSIVQTHSVASGVFFQGQDRLLFWDGHSLQTISFEEKIRSSFTLRDTMYVSFQGGGLSRLVGELPIRSQLTNEMENVEIIAAEDSPTDRSILLTTGGIFECKQTNFFDCRLVSEQAARTLQNKTVTDLALLRYGWIAIATRESGILIFNEQGVLQQTLDTDVGLPAVDVSGLTVDKAGALWASLGNGIARLAWRNLLSEPDTKHYAPISIRRVRVQDKVLFDGLDHPALQQIVVGPRAGRFRIEFAAAEYSGVGGVTYRTRLDGLEQNWSPWREESYREYTNLPANFYTFRVESRNINGHISGQASISFDVLPAWYQTGWAYFLWITVIGLFLAVATHSFNRLQLSRLTSRNAELEKEVITRTAQIREKKQALQQVNNELNQLNDRLRVAYGEVGGKNIELRKKNQALLMANKALNDRSEELREALEENKEILGITAHDLKNPLSGIIGMTEIILYDAQSFDAKAFREEAMINTRMMKDQAEMMLQIIKDLSDKYRFGNKNDLRFERANLSDLVETVLPWNNRQANEKNIRIHYERTENLEADVDISAIQRAMDNLVSNAVKYNHPGRNVYVGLERNEGSVRFKVRDEGQGLSEEDMKKVFGKLQRLSAKPTGGEHSTGLGLYIVKQLVENHDGRVGVESEFGKGSTFWFELPLKRDERNRVSSAD